MGAANGRKVAIVIKGTGKHTLQVGSYGRGTATSASDLDVLVSLPRAEYERYDA